MRHFLFHPLTVLILTGVTVVLAVSAYRLGQKNRTSTEYLGVLEQEMDKISSEVFHLQHQAAEAADPITKEKIIRNELLMQRPGEVVVEVPQAPAESTVASSAAELTPAQQWWQLLFQ